MTTTGNLGKRRDREKERQRDKEKEPTNGSVREKKTNGFVVGGFPDDSVRSVSCGRRDPPKQIQP
jgi:hypothetical protein